MVRLGNTAVPAVAAVAPLGVTASKCVVPVLLSLKIHIAQFQMVVFESVIST